ncbi:MAG TPA: mechanosensitive ion channel domain-containing protein [Gemmatimonadaceae bacterium]|nr:mechanosensitive ion channel domain-containing protein [Gemmatimonadaceae bacterium]
MPPRSPRDPHDPLSRYRGAPDDHRTVGRTVGRTTGRDAVGRSRGGPDAARRVRGATGQDDDAATRDRRTRTRLRTATRRRPGVGDYRRAADARLSRFRQATTLAVALTGLALLLGGAPDVPAQDTIAPGSTLVADSAARADSARADSLARAAAAAAEDTAGVAATTARSVQEATGTIRQLVRGFYRYAPKLLIALLLLMAAGLVARLVRPVLRRLLASFARAEAISALAVIALWLLALGAALSVLAGDARALLGSVGLFGLALSWALQAPIESFTGWLLNSFRGYYRIGDRILVGDVFGDVYRIDFLTTTVWEAGGPGKPVQGAQPTGALITFPNSEVLRANITNYSRDFPYVWDEITVGVSNESDLEYAISIVGGVVERLVGAQMVGPAEQYMQLLTESGLPLEVSPRPELYATPTDSWMDVTVRYLVPVRQRRHWASELQRALARELARPEHAGRIVGSYPVTRVELRDAGGVAERARGDERTP